MRDYNDPVITSFENGMEMVTIANRLLNTSTIGFTVGMRDDPPWFDGATHTTEHLIFRRGSTFSGRAVNRMMRRHLGGSNGPGMNVYTMHSHCAFGHQDLLRRRHLHHVFGMNGRILFDNLFDMRRLRGTDDRPLIIDQDVYDLERAAVHNEDGEYVDSHMHEATKCAYAALYRGGNPARRVGTGDEAQMRVTKLGRLKQWAQGQFVPSRMRVILLGPTANEGLRMVREVGFNELPAWKSSPQVYCPSDEVPVLTDVREVVTERPGIEMCYLSLVWPTDTAYKCDRLALEVLESVLKDRVEEAIREENRLFDGGLYHPAVDWDATSSHGAFSVLLATRGDWDYARSLVDRVLAVIERLKNDVSEAMDEDVKDSRENLADVFIEEYKFNPGALTDRMLSALANGDPELKKFRVYHSDVIRVTSKRVREAARQYLHPDRYVLSVVRSAP
jgi:predicted Zn-dependent peptidase